MNEPTTAAVRRGWRLNAFQLGLIVGLLSPVLLALAVHMSVGRWPQGLARPPYNVLIESDGTDVSAHGGAKLVVSNEHGALIQTCRDGCDDLRVEDDSRGEDAFRIRVLDASGNCIACDPGRYVESGYDAFITRWRIAGRQALTVKVGLLTRTADGSLRETTSAAGPQAPIGAPPASAPTKP